MLRRNNTTRNASRSFRRLSTTAVLAAMLLLVIGAITVFSRQRAEAERKSQMAEKTNFTKQNAAVQDGQVSSEAQPQDLTAAEAAKLGQGLKELVNQSTEGLVEVKHADGSVSVDLEGRFQNVTVARINKDGSITQSCVDNPKAAGAFFGIDPKLIDNTSDGTSVKPAKVNPSKTRN